MRSQERGRWWLAATKMSNRGRRAVNAAPLAHGRGRHTKQSDVLSGTPAGSDGVEDIAPEGWTGAIAAGNRLNRTRTDSKIRTHSLRSAVALFAIALCVAAVPASAQTDYPNRPISIVVQFSAGGGSDLLSRVLAQQLTVQMGVPVTVINKAGANGNIAGEMVARAPADGYTVLSQTSAIAISPALYSKLGYDVTKDLAAVTQTGITPFVLITHPSVPAMTVAEFIGYAKANPGKLAYASNGLGNIGHLGTVMFMQASGTSALHVPYKGAADSVTAVTGGSVQFSLQTPGAIGAFLKDRRIKALAVTSLKRSVALPDVPTLSETVIPNFEVTTWQGMMVPANTPPAIIDRLNRELVKALQDPNVQSRFANLDTVPVGTGAAQYGAYIKAEVARWAAAVQSAGVKPE